MLHTPWLRVVLAAATLAVPVRPAFAATDGDTPVWQVSPADRLPEWLHIGGQLRGRFESPSGTSLLNGQRDSYYASRIRIDFGLKPFSWLGFYGEAQDARVGAYNTPDAPTSVYDPLDVRKAYVEIRALGATIARLRVGRQELSFGGERLIGPAEWGISRTFDAVDLTLSRGKSKLDLFAASPVLVDSERSDRHRPADRVFGAYGSFQSLLPGVTIEPYLLLHQSGVGPRSFVLSSPGLRLTGKRGPLDFTAEGVVQRGSLLGDTVSAHAFALTLGWTLAPVSWWPRLSVEYNAASGDHNPNDQLHQTFDQFYPSNHSYFGMMDQFGWKNLRNARAGFDFLIAGKIKVRADYNDFFLDSRNDALYALGGAVLLQNPNAGSSHVGWSVTATALYHATRIWDFGAGWGRIVAGEFLKQSGHESGYQYPYLMFVGSF